MAIGRHNWRVTSSDVTARPAAPLARTPHTNTTHIDTVVDLGDDSPQRIPWLDRSHPKLVAVAVVAAMLCDIALNLASMTVGTAARREPAEYLCWTGSLLVVALATSVALARWRHTRPLAVMAVAVVFALVNDSLFPVYADGGVGFVMTLLLFCFLATYYVTLRHGTPVAVVWFVAGLAGDTAVMGVQQLVASERTAWFGTLIMLGALKGMLAMVAVALASRRRYLSDLLERNRMLALERDQRAQLAVADERARIAAEMHDVVSHSLAVMVTLADGAGRVLPGDVPAAQEALGQIGATGRAAVADMRRLLAFLRADADLAPQPGLAQLGDLVDQMRDAGLPITLSTDAGLPDDPSLGLAVYRIVQEGLTNVLRHAPNPAWVRVGVAQPSPGRVEVRVANGPSLAGAVPGAALGSGAGQGLVGVRQRVAVWDGELRAGRTLEGGWDLRAQLRTDGHADNKE